MCQLYPIKALFGNVEIYQIVCLKKSISILLHSNKSDCESVKISLLKGICYPVVISRVICGALILEVDSLVVLQGLSKFYGGVLGSTIKN